MSSLRRATPQTTSPATSSTSTLRCCSSFRQRTPRRAVVEKVQRHESQLTTVTIHDQVRTMQILANALPGFRDLRSPLIAGYSWLLFAWLVVAPDLSHTPQNRLGAALFNLGHHIGHIGLGVAISVVAYLVGSASQVASETLRATWISVAALLWEALPAGPDRIFALPNVRNPAVETITAQIDRAVLAMGQLRAAGLPPRHDDLPQESFERSVAEAREKDQSELETRVERARAEARRELTLPATLLVGKDPTLYAEVDRLSAEGELRLSAIAPLLAILTLGASESSLLWLLGLPLLVTLLDQGVRKDVASRALIANAIARNVVESDSAKRFVAWVDSLEEKQRPEASVA